MTGCDMDFRPKVLFVDDEENILRSVSRLFIDEPIEVLTATSGQEGLDILSGSPDIAVIVSDQRMPGMSGAEFLEKSKSISPDAVRIILTGYADVHAAVDAINLGGAWRYLAKPWNDDDLIRTVREAAQHYGLVMENRRLSEIIRQQNEELKKWNSELEYLVQQQTIDIQNKNKTLESMNERLRRNFTDSLSAFSALLELRDRTAGNHSRSVSELSANMARRLNLPQDEIAAIGVAGLLHDIGKIGVPDAVLGKAFEDMSPEDREKYMTHPVRGQAAIDAIEDLRKAGVLIRHHHERWDGTGFPDRLRAKAIPLGARIIAIADYFDRTVNSRQGQDAVQNALIAVKKNLGTRFDPELFSVLEHCAPVPDESAPKTAKAAEMAVSLDELKPGMVLRRDVKSGTGLLLLGAGAVLSEKTIEALKRYFQIDPSKEKFFVMVK